MLRFVLTGFLMAAPLAVVAQERLPNLYDVTVVETWDKLNVRAAPDGQAEIIGTLASFGWALAVAGIDARDIATRIAESVRNLAWLGFLYALLRQSGPRVGVAVGATFVVVALVCTAAGLCVAIPAYFFHRYFRGLVGDYVVDMEKDVIVLMDELAAHSEAAALARASRPRPPAAVTAAGAQETA